MHQYEIVNIAFQYGGKPVYLNIDLKRIIMDYTQDGNACAGGFVCYWVTGHLVTVQ